MENVQKHQIGDLRISFNATAYGFDGKPVHNGWMYADSTDIQNLREWAAGLFLSKWWTIGKVGINGRELRLGYQAWSPTGKHQSHEWVLRPVELLISYSPRDLEKSCYPTTILDYYEIVHERRVDNSCKCGEFKPDPNGYAGRR